MSFFKNHTDTLQDEAELRIAPEAPARPDVYPGTPMTSVSLPGSDLPGPRNRRTVRRRVSPFTMVLLLLASAVAIVLYIGNIIAVDQLLNEINTLEVQHRRILMEQEILKAQINKMASLERIQEMAEKDLGLVTPGEPPVWLSIDQEKIEKVQHEAGRP